MPAEFALDKRLARHSFERAAAGYDAAAVLQNEICGRMLGRLEYIKIEPATVIDAGCGTGNAVPELHKRYPRAHLVALDLALAMARRAQLRLPWWRRMRRGVAAICGDIEALPLRAASADLVWSNLALQWINDLPRACAELRRVLKPGGLLMFSTMGPDTLKELRAAFRGADAYDHVHRFVDMHDLGDALAHAGFADPVMDMEHITMTYSDVATLLKDLRTIGARNVATGRNPGLGARAALEAMKRNYEALRLDGRLPATFEIVYGHAWAPQPRTTADGRPIIPIKVRP